MVPADLKRENLSDGPNTAHSEEQAKALTKSNVNTSGSRYVKKEELVPIPRFEAELVIEGQLNDAIWQSTALFGDFLQTQPGDNVAPAHP